MIWSLLKPFMNPTVIFGVIMAVVVASWASDVRAFFNTRDLIKPWQQAVKDRDDAIERKDKLTETALLARDNAKTEIQELRAHLDDAEIKRKMAGVNECRWTDDDLRVLNATTK